MTTGMIWFERALIPQAHCTGLSAGIVFQGEKNCRQASFSHAAVNRILNAERSVASVRRKIQQVERRLGWRTLAFCCMTERII